MSYTVRPLICWKKTVFSCCWCFFLHSLKSCSVELRSGDWPLKNISFVFLLLQLPLGCYPLALWIGVWSALSREYSPVCFTVHPSASVCSHTCLWHDTLSTMFDRRCGTLCDMSWIIPIILVQVYFGFIWLKIGLVFGVLALLDVFWWSLIRPFLFFSVTSGFHLVFVNATQDCRFWHWYLTSSRLFLPLMLWSCFS